MVSKVVRGSAITLIGNVIFRFGGWFYRFILATLLGPAAYGIFGLVTPFQGIFQILSSGGLPPAIAKYVSEYNALNQTDCASHVVYTSLKIMIILGLLFGVIMVFFIAPVLAGYYNKPEALLPLQTVGLIIPFSAIVGGFRGAFQGIYKMEYIVYTKGVEQIAMILFSTFLVILGLSTFGAVLGSVFAFIIASICAAILFKKYLKKSFKPSSLNSKLSIADEIKLAKKLIFYAIPVSITGLAEMGVYTICTMIMGVFLASSSIGIFIAADPIARLPLIISVSLSTTILPAVSEAYATKNKYTLDRYVNNSYKYGMFFVIPACVGIAIFSREILGLIFFTNPAYMQGALSLSILVIGMTFYSIYAISSSIVQGIGNPKIPMYLLLLGVVITFFLGWYLIPIYGIVGGAIATTVSSIIMMIPMFLIQFRITKTKAPYVFIIKITLSSLIMIIPYLILPKNSLGLIIGMIICPIIFLIGVTLFKTLDSDDIEWFKNIFNKTGFLKKYIYRILDLIDKYSN